MDDSLGMMNESLLSVDEDGFPISTILLNMGIAVKNQSYETRLKSALDSFNTCYLETMDFLNQILPLAKQHFVKHDAILLPKTPAKKRTRRQLKPRNADLQNIPEQHSSPITVQPKNNSTLPTTAEFSSEQSSMNVKSETQQAPVKRVTRNSRAKAKIQAAQEDKENVESGITVVADEEVKAERPQRTTRSSSRGKGNGTRKQPTRTSKRVSSEGGKNSAKYLKHDSEETPKDESLIEESHDRETVVPRMAVASSPEEVQTKESTRRSSKRASSKGARNSLRNSSEEMVCSSAKESKDSEAVAVVETTSSPKQLVEAKKSKRVSSRGAKNSSKGLKENSDETSSSLVKESKDSDTTDVADTTVSNHEQIKEPTRRSKRVSAKGVGKSSEKSKEVSENQSGLNSEGVESGYDTESKSKGNTKTLKRSRSASSPQLLGERKRSKSSDNSDQVNANITEAMDVDSSADSGGNTAVNIAAKDDILPSAAVNSVPKSNKSSEFDLLDNVSDSILNNSSQGIHGEDKIESSTTTSKKARDGDGCMFRSEVKINVELRQDNCNTENGEAMRNYIIVEESPELRSEAMKRNESEVVESVEVINPKRRRSEDARIPSPVIPMATDEELKFLNPSVIVLDTPDPLKNVLTPTKTPGDAIVPASPSIGSSVLASPAVSNTTHTLPSETPNKETVNGNTTAVVLDKRETASAVGSTSNGTFVRRSTRRSSRRVSVLSLGNPGNRRSSRRTSRRSSLFKKPPQVLKKTTKVNLVISMTSSESGTESGMECDRPAAKVHVSPVKRELSSTDTEDDIRMDGEDDDGPTTSTPEDNGPRRSLRLSGKSSLKRVPSKRLKPSSSDEETRTNSEQKEGIVAGIIHQINKNNKIGSKQSSICSTPTGQKRAKRFGSSVKRSCTKPSNIVGGNIRSFIRRPSTKKTDPEEVTRIKKMELIRKQEKEKERLDQAELRRKNWADEQRRKREEKQKRVADAKAAREKEEHEKKARQLEEKKQTLQALEQQRKKKEQEEEGKKKVREQRKKEADARRLRENEERLKRLHEKEQEEKTHREMVKRIQEQEEHERKQRILEEKRVQEQKQRERQREQSEERERKLREIKEKQDEKMKDGAERKEKERKQKDQEDRERKRIALLIQEKMEHEKKQYEEKRKEREEKERREREEQRRKLQATKLASASASAMNRSVASAQSADSYMMTPPPAQTRKPSTDENYDISDIRSDESTDEEDCPRKKVPAWAQGATLKMALLHQDEPRRQFMAETGTHIIDAPKLEEIFTKKRRRFYQRTSSAHWETPPLKKVY